MRLTRAITLLAAGAATVWFLDRRVLLPGRTAVALPPPAGPLPREPAAAEPLPAQPLATSEQPTREQPAVELEEDEEEQHDAAEASPVDVTAVVDDLIASHDENAIVDAEVVEEMAQPQPRSDEEIAASVREELERHPGVEAGAISVDARDGLIHLRGEIDSPGLIRELELRVRELEGVHRVHNLLHLPGTPPPA